LPGRSGRNWFDPKRDAGVRLKMEGRKILKFEIVLLEEVYK
jgi:hypothetical protein